MLSTRLRRRMKQESTVVIATITVIIVRHPPSRPSPLNATAAPAHRRCRRDSLEFKSIRVLFAGLKHARIRRTIVNSKWWNAPFFVSQKPLRPPLSSNRTPFLDDCCILDIRIFTGRQFPPPRKKCQIVALHIALCAAQQNTTYSGMTMCEGRENGTAIEKKEDLEESQDHEDILNGP